MVSWEYVVNTVVISGEPERVEKAACAWETTLVNVGDASSELDRALTELAGQEGPSVEALRTYLGDTKSVLNDVQDRNRGVASQVRTAGEALAIAIADTPIPPDLISLVERYKADYRVGTGQVDWVPDGWIGEQMMAIGRSRAHGFLQDATPDVVRQWGEDLRDSIYSGAEDAANAFRALQDTYQGVHASLPEPTGVRPEIDPNWTPSDSTMPPGGIPPGGVPPLGTGTAPPFAAVPPVGAGPWDGLPSDPVADPVADPADWDAPGSGLAGIGDGGIGGLGPTGLGPGMSGLGRGVDGGGVGGLGAGRSGLPAGMGGVPMVGGMPPGGAGSAGRRGGAGVGGVGGSGAHGDTDGDERYSWLTEDEDVWGIDSIDVVSPSELGVRRPDDPRRRR